jgi:hypothetical protein
MSDRYTSEELIPIADRVVHLQMLVEEVSASAPEKRLMAAVLKDALRYFEGHVLASDHRNQRLYADAEEWFASRDPEPMFSFENICVTLGLHARHIRDSLFAWRDAERAGLRVPGPQVVPRRGRPSRDAVLRVAAGHGRAA